MKKNITKKVISVLLATCLLVSLLSGCNNNSSQSTTEKDNDVTTTAGTEDTSTTENEGFQHDPNLNEVGVEPIAKETVTLKIMIQQNSNVEDYNTNGLTKLLEQEANVKLEFMEIPSAQMEEKIRLMASGGGDDLPDIIIHSMSDALVEELASEKMIIPLDDYYENCSVYFKDGFDRVLADRGVDFFNYLKTGDGHVYTVPQFNETVTGAYPARIWVYQPWLDALKIKAEDIVTTEDFYNLLYAFKTQDPNGNGEADEIPALSHARENGGKFIDGMMGAFISPQSGADGLNATNGVLSAPYVEEGWKEGIKYIKSLIDAGLYDASSFTMNLDSFKTIMNAEGIQKVGCFVYGYQSFLTSSHPSYYEWTMLPPLTGPEGVCTTTYVAEVPNNRGFITKNCKSPELAFRLLDLMGREDITITSRWGTQDVAWSYVEDLKKTDEYKNVAFDQTFNGYPAYIHAYNSKWGTLQNEHWNNWNPSFRTAEIGCGYNAATLSFAKEGLYNFELARVLPDYEAAAPKEKVAKLKYSGEALAEAAEIKNEIGALVSEKLSHWLTGAADIDKEWDAYVKQLESLGLSRYLELAQEAYDKTK